MLGSTHIPTSAAPIHLALSSDNLTLSVCVNENGALKLYFYDVRALATKVCAEIYNEVPYSVTWLIAVLRVTVCVFSMHELL